MSELIFFGLYTTERIFVFVLHFAFVALLFSGAFSILFSHISQLPKLKGLLSALDRMEELKELDSEKYHKAAFDVNTYFNDVLGVTKMPTQKPQLIVLKIVKEHAPYVLTEGKATGIPAVLKALKDNGSPGPHFDTDDDKSFFEIELFKHPDTASITDGKEATNKKDGKGLKHLFGYSPIKLQQ